MKKQDEFCAAKVQQIHSDLLDMVQLSLINEPAVLYVNDKMVLKVRIRAEINEDDYKVFFENSYRLLNEMAIDKKVHNLKYYDVLSYRNSSIPSDFSYHLYLRNNWGIRLYLD